MKMVKLFIIFALSGSQLIASERQTPTTAPILRVIATAYDPVAQALTITCFPDAIKTLDKIQFEEETDRWSNTLYATLGGSRQPIENNSEWPRLNTKRFKVDMDEKTGNIIFLFMTLSRPQSPQLDRIET